MTPPAWAAREPDETPADHQLRLFWSIVAVAIHEKNSSAARRQAS